MNNLHLVFLISIILFYSKNEIFYFLNNENMENKDEDTDEKNNPLYSDYTKLIKSTKEMGFTKDGSINGFIKNSKKGIKTIRGILDDQTYIVKGNRPIGTKLVYDTGFNCKDSKGNEHPQHIYLSNMGNKDLGLSMEIGNAIAKIASGAVTGLSSALKGTADTTCSEVTLKTINNEGEDGTETVYIQNSELSDISKDDIVEGYDNINNLLADDELFYKNFIIFIYLFGISFLFLFLIFNLIINSN